MLINYLFNALEHSIIKTVACNTLMPYFVNIACEAALIILFLM